MSTCMNCDGCGKIASGDDGAPWTAWEALPPEAKVAVRLGLVYPVDCPECDGTGERTRDGRGKGSDA